MVEFLNIFIGGLITGAIYGLLAIGFSLVFGVTKVLNLAQGAFVVMGALIVYSLRVDGRLPLLVAFLVALAIMALTTAAVQWSIIRPASRRISHTNLLMLLGGMLTAYEGIAFVIWGSTAYTLPPFSGNKPLSAHGVDIASQDIWVVAVAAVCVIGIWLFLNRTHAGTAFRATAENPNAARLMGISTDRTVLFAFCISAVLGVIAGVVILPITSITFASVAPYTTFGIIAVTLGGLGTVFGAGTGGLVLGIVEALVAGYVSDLFGTVISLGLLILILIWRPQGLLGRIRGARADVAEARAGHITLPVRMGIRGSRASTVVIVAVMVALPFIMSTSGDMHAINITGIFCLTIVGLGLLTGVAGQVSLGQAGFMAVGGYTSSILIVQHGWPPIVALLAGVCASVVVAVVLGLAGSRVRGMYLAIVTLAFGVLVESLATGLSFTGGPSGLTGIPSFRVGAVTFGTAIHFYFLIWVLVGASVVVTANLLRSNRGRMLWAMHSDDIGTRSLGLNLIKNKVVVFAISAIMASAAGSLYACYFHYFSPNMVGSSVSLELITMLVIGGSGTLVGPLLGTAVLTFFPELTQGIQGYEPLVDGALLVMFLRYLPTGLYGGILTVARNIVVPVRRYLVNTVRKVETAEPQLRAGGATAAIARQTRTANEAPGATGARTLGLSRGLDSGQGSAQTVPDSSDCASSRGSIGAGVPASMSVACNARIPALRVSGVSKSFGGVLAVDDVSFDVKAGSIGALIGPNGAGKSTLFNLATNLYRPDAGRVEVFGRDITKLKPDVIARRGLFRTFQTSRVFPGLNVLENILIGGYRMGRSGYMSDALWLLKASREEKRMVIRARAIAEVMGLGDVGDQPAHKLPLAAQKYLDLGRALMSGANLLLLDEPGAGMNDAETLELGAVLLSLKRAGLTVLVVDHNMALVMGVADSVTVMNRGRVIACGPPQAVQSNPEVIDAYFGSSHVGVS